MRSLLLIVIYNKQLKDASTLTSLINSNYHGDVFIFNNGPALIDFSEGIRHPIEKRFGNVYFEQDVSNKPLSVMYNDILSIDGYDYYYLFDDDTSIPCNFFSVHSEPSDLNIPVIKDTFNEKVFYPLVNNKIFDKQVSLNNNDDIISIGSGLMLSQKLLGVFRRHNMKPFDERFSLYGVDFSLFRRIRILKFRGEFFSINIKGIICHSLSRVDVAPSKTRNIERIIDQVLCKIHYSRRLPIITYPHLGLLILTSAIKGDFITSKIIINLIRDKCHPRSKCFKSRW